MALNCTYTELQEFPSDFIIKAITYLQQQTVASKIKQSMEQTKSKHKTLSK